MDQISYCKGAGDYVEVVKTDKSTILYSRSLKELEKLLPSMFCTGNLNLVSKMTIPVSRRTMPMVRDSLA